jgi:hypothetical protein
MTNPDKSEQGLLRIAIQHTPSPDDPEGADEFYKALGILIVAWGRLEGHFVACLLMLMNLPGGKEISERLPMQFDERARVWRQAFETMTALQPFKDSALQALAEIKDIATDRHVVAHSFWEKFEATEPLSIDVLTIKHKNKTKNGLETRRFTVTTAMLREVGEKANRLNLTLTPLSQFLTRYRSELNPPPADIRIV